MRVVVQSGGVWGLALDLLLFTLDARTVRVYRNFNARAVDIPAGNVLTLAASALVSFVSADRPVRLLGHLSATTGADAAREASAGTSLPTLYGTGVGVAVIDSGVYAAHKSFLDKSNRVRVVYGKDFTGEGRTDDPYGHGSHVASVAAGNGRVSNGAYTGVAPNANVVNLRALDSRGAGTASGLLAGFNYFEQGTGQLNVEGAVRLAKLVRTDLSNSTPVGDPLLTSGPPAPQTTIAGHTFTWSRGLLFDYTYAVGTDLIAAYQKVYGLGLLLGDGVITGDTLVSGDDTDSMEAPGDGGANF